MKDFASLYFDYTNGTIFLIHNYLSKQNKQIGKVFFKLGYNDNPNDVKLTLLKINEEFQNVGLGKFFVAKIIDYFKNTSIEKIHVLASPFGPSNKKLDLKTLIKFYEDLGFKKSEIQNYDTSLNLEMYYQY